MKEHTYYTNLHWTGNTGKEQNPTGLMKDPIPFLWKENNPLKQARIRLFAAIKQNIIRKKCWSHHSPPVICSGFYIFVQRLLLLF